MSYCIRDSKGQYLTHSVDVQRGTSSLFFTPSPWMAYLFETATGAEGLAAEYGGIACEWERPEGSKRAR